MAAPDVVTIPVRFTSEEHRLIEDLAAMRDMTMSDVVRELMGFEREDKQIHHTRPPLRVVSASAYGSAVGRIGERRPPATSCYCNSSAPGRARRSARLLLLRAVRAIGATGFASSAASSSPADGRPK
jgi:hypothetical protein